MFNCGLLMNLSLCKIRKTLYNKIHFSYFYINFCTEFFEISYKRTQFNKTRVSVVAFSNCIQVRKLKNYSVRSFTMRFVLRSNCYFVEGTLQHVEMDEGFGSGGRSSWVRRAASGHTIKGNFSKFSYEISMTLIPRGSVGKAKKRGKRLG